MGDRWRKGRETDPGNVGAPPSHGQKTKRLDAFGVPYQMDLETLRGEPHGDGSIPLSVCHSVD